jgi:hypothetical protein
VPTTPVPRPALVEIDLARDIGVDHPLERTVDGGAPDARFLPAHDVEEIVRAQMAFLTQKNTEDAVALARALAAGRTKTRIIGKESLHQ